MKVFVTGGTGFAGREVVRQLSTAGHEIIALVRPGSEVKLPNARGVNIHVGDVTDLTSLPDVIRDCDAVFDFSFVPGNSLPPSLP